MHHVPLMWFTLFRVWAWPSKWLAPDMLNTSAMRFLSHATPHSMHANIIPNSLDPVPAQGHPQADNRNVAQNAG